MLNINQNDFYSLMIDDFLLDVPEKALIVKHFKTQ